MVAVVVAGGDEGVVGVGVVVGVMVAVGVGVAVMVAVGVGVGVVVAVGVGVAAEVVVRRRASGSRSVTSK